MLLALRDDLREGARRVRRSPRLAVMAIGTLALGIGAATAVFTIAHTVLYASPPFRQPDRIVYLQGRTPGWTMGVSEADRRDYRSEQGLLDAAALTNYAEFSWTGQSLPGFDGSEVLRGLVVTDEYFRVFDQPLALGRGFVPDEGRPGRGAVVISYALWQQRFGGRPDVIGQTMTLNREMLPIVGVTGPRFLTYESYEVTVWATFQPRTDRRSHQYSCFARLARRVPIDSAQRRLDLVNARLARAYPDSNRQYSVAVMPLLAQMHEEARPVLAVLVAAVLCLLLIAAANVASLLLAKATADAQEMAIRSSLGASRLRLFRMMVVHSLVLAFAASLAGLLAAVWLIDGARALTPPSLQLDWVFAIDFRVFVAAFLAAAIAGLLAGIAPASETFRLATGGLRPSVHRSRLLQTIVTAEIALAVFLSVGAGLLAKSFVELVNRPLGYQTDKLLGMRVRLEGERYATVDQKADYWARLTERVAALPGVAKAASVSDLPMGHQYIGGQFDVDGRTTPGDRQPWAHCVAASPGYFATVGVPIIAGRAFNETDAASAEPVAIVDDVLAQKFWPGVRPIGRTIKVSGTNLNNGVSWLRIVGVVGRIRHAGPQGDYRGEIYVPYRQGNLTTMFLVVRTSTAPEHLVSPIRAALRSIDPNVPAFEIRTLDQAFTREIAGPRLPMTMIGTFAVIALALAGLGLFGVVAYWVSQRLKEMGVRAALGARPSDLSGIVLRQGGRLLAIGLTTGVAGSIAAMRVLRSQLYGMSERDLTVYAAAVGVAALVTLVACWLPAVRAARVDPAAALREQ